MSRLIISGFILFSVLSGSLCAQNYISISSGYGFPAGTGEIAAQLYDLRIFDGEHSSYGEGVKLNLAIGRMFAPNLGFEISLQYSNGHTFTPKDYYTNTECHVNYFAIIPSVVFSTTFEKVSPYIKAGIIAALPKGTDIAKDAQAGDMTTELTGGDIPFGFCGKIGVEYMQFRFAVFCEAGFTALSWTPTKLKSSWQGVSVERSLNDEGPIGYSRTFSRTLPLSSFDLCLGIKYKF